MYRIPKQYRDLRRHIFFTDLRRICLFVLWIAIFVASAIFYNYNHQTYADDRRIVGWRLVALIVFAVVTGFFLFRLWKFFTDRTYSGTIEFAGLTHTYTQSDEPYGFKPMSYAERTNTKLTVITKKQKKRRLRFEQKIGSYWYYADGQRIVHFHGCPYPINLDPTAPHGYICVACGRMHDRYIDECEYCYLSLIDPKVLAEEE
ncbi:MAG: hypothetical protein IJW16_00720 [Clostridia bacterium]|nr:hypothetical protein [Clostridia bacterium]